VLKALRVVWNIKGASARQKSVREIIAPNFLQPSPPGLHIAAHRCLSRRIQNALSRRLATIAVTPIPFPGYIAK
jgi:hypothetical protein